MLEIWLLCGAITQSPTQKKTILNVSGSNFSADSVKEALNNMTRSTMMYIYSANLTLTSMYVAPTLTQLGYNVIQGLTGIKLTTYSANSQNIYGPLNSASGRDVTVSVGGSYIITWNYTVTPFNLSHPR